MLLVWKHIAANGTVVDECTFQTPKIDSDNKINPKVSTTQENGAIYHISQYTDTLENISKSL